MNAGDLHHAAKARSQHEAQAPAEDNRVAGISLSEVDHRPGKVDADVEETHADLLPTHQLR